MREFRNNARRKFRARSPGVSFRRGRTGERDARGTGRWRSNGTGKCHCTRINTIPGLKKWSESPPTRGRDLFPVTRPWRNRNTRKEDPTGVLPLRMLSRRSVKRKQLSPFHPHPFLGSTTPGKPFRYTRLSLLFSTATAIASCICLSFSLCVPPRTLDLTPSVMSTPSRLRCDKISTPEQDFFKIKSAEMQTRK